MSLNLTVAVASGKGGTGKTTVSACLALAAAEAGHKTSYLDCDVEEPNGHLFLKPQIRRRSYVGIPVPEVDEDKCISCGACGEICQFSAIICIPPQVLTFENMCHGCGGCTLVCPVGAISERDRRIGVVEEGRSDGIGFTHGRLDVGEAMSPPLIKAVRASGKEAGLNIVDVPPGTSCPVISAVRGADYVLLITEPTPFGINDLGLAVDMIKELGINHSVVINRSDPEYTMARDFCAERNIKVLAEIPDDRRVAEAYSRGELPYTAIPDYRELFQKLFHSVLEEVRR